MPTRRRFLQTASASTCLPLLQSGPALGKVLALPHGDEDVTQYVDVRVGTGGHGHTFPGATVPFGAIQLSPDTYTAGWDWCAGYYDSDTSLMGFSHTHLSGTGCGDLLDVLLIPNVGEVKWNPGPRENPSAGYRAPFSHADETMTPGYYSVPLKDRQVLAELTATERVGLHRYTFHRGGDSHFILDFEHAYTDQQNPVTDAILTLAGSDTITGSRTVHSWANGRRIYFAAQFSKAFTAAELMQDGTLLSPGSKQAAGTSLKAAVHYAVAPEEQVLVRVSVSGVSVENALGNLKAEMPEYAFDGTRAAAKKKWQAELSRIRVETADPNLLLLAVPHDGGADDLLGQQRRVLRHGRADPQTPYRRAELQHLLAMGYFPGPPSFVHALPAGPCARDGELPGAHGRAKPGRHARVAAAGQGNRHHDRLPFGKRDG